MWLLDRLIDLLEFYPLEYFLITGNFDSVAQWLRLPRMLQIKIVIGL